MERLNSPDNDVYKKIDSDDTVPSPESSEKRGRRKERGRKSSKEIDSESVSLEKRGRGRQRGSKIRKTRKNQKEPLRNQSCFFLL